MFLHIFLGCIYLWLFDNIGTTTTAHHQFVALPATTAVWTHPILYERRSGQHAAHTGWRHVVTFGRDIPKNALPRHRGCIPRGCAVPHDFAVARFPVPAAFTARHTLPVLPFVSDRHHSQHCTLDCYHTHPPPPRTVRFTCHAFDDCLFCYRLFAAARHHYGTPLPSNAEPKPHPPAPVTDTAATFQLPYYFPVCHTMHAFYTVTPRTRQTGLYSRRLDLGGFTTPARL